MAATNSFQKSKKHHQAKAKSVEARKPTSELVLSIYRNAKWATLGLAAALCLAPLAAGYTGAAVALWTSLAMGAVIGGLGYRRQYRWATLAGAVAMIAPWTLGFSGVSAALASCLLLGAAVVVVDGYAGFLVHAGGGRPVAQRHGSKP